MPFLLAVAHLTEDLTFQWADYKPLTVNENIEFPQVDMTSMENIDCATNYTTGKTCSISCVFLLIQALSLKETLPA